MSAVSVNIDPARFPQHAASNVSRKHRGLDLHMESGLEEVGGERAGYMHLHS